MSVSVRGLIRQKVADSLAATVLPLPRRAVRLPGLIPVFNCSGQSPTAAPRTEDPRERSEVDNRALGTRLVSATENLTLGHSQPRSTSSPTTGSGRVDHLCTTALADGEIPAHQTAMSIVRTNPFARNPALSGSDVRTLGETSHFTASRLRNFSILVSGIPYPQPMTQIELGTPRSSSGGFTPGVHACAVRISSNR